VIGDWLAYWFYYSRYTIVEVLVVALSAGTFIYCVIAIKRSLDDRRVLIARKALIPERRQAQKELRTSLGRAFISSVFLAIAVLALFTPALFTPARIPPTALSLFSLVLLTAVVIIVAYLQYADTRDRATDIAELLIDQRRREAQVAGVIVVDRYNIVHQFNAAAGEIFGYPPDRVLGQRLIMLIPERFRDAHLRGLARAYASTEPGARMGSRLGLPGLHADGREIPLHIVLHELQGASGKMFMAVFTLEPEAPLSQSTIEERRHHRLLDETILNTGITQQAKDAAERAHEAGIDTNEQLAASVAVGNDAVASLRALIERIERERQTGNEALRVATAATESTAALARQAIAEAAALARDTLAGAATVARETVAVAAELAHSQDDGPIEVTIVAETPVPVAVVPPNPDV